MLSRKCAFLLISMTLVPFVDPLIPCLGPWITSKARIDNLTCELRLNNDEMNCIVTRDKLKIYWTYSSSRKYVANLN